MFLITIPDQLGTCRESYALNIRGFVKSSYLMTLGYEDLGT